MSYILLIPISNNINFQSTIIIHNHHTHQQYGTTHQFNLNHSSSIYHNMHFLIYHTIKASIFIITYMNTSYISTIQQHQQFNAYLRASSLSISYHITYQIRETETIPQPISQAQPEHFQTTCPQALKVSTPPRTDFVTQNPLPSFPKSPIKLQYSHIHNLSHNHHTHTQHLNTQTSQNNKLYQG